jgi:DNA-binding protein HU-beta
MNRKDLVETVAREADLSTAQADAALKALVDGVVAAVAGGDKVTIAGFGTFESRQRSARTGRNPQTGETMEIAASVAPAFKPASGFKQAVAGA